MEIKTLLIFLTVSSAVGIVSAAASTDMNLYDVKLEAVHSALSAEMSAFKRIILINVLPEIEALKQRQCRCSNTAAIEADETKEKLGDNNYQDIVNRITHLVTAFENEKLQRKLLSAVIANLSENIQTNHHNMSELIAKNRQLSENNQDNLGKHNDEIIVVKETLLDLTDKTEQFHGYLNNISHKVESYCPRKKKTLQQPSFLSDWFVMKSGDETLSERVIEHGIGKLPAKVDVQIKPLNDTDEEWVFTGDSVFQGDDDTRNEYSGVVYLYNETHVLLKTPTKNNQYDSGILMSTGGQDNRFVNMNDEQYRFSEAFIRVRIWTSDDLPKPTFTTDWLALDVMDERTSFLEFSHGLLDYPGLVIVQIKSSIGLISEGMGAVMSSPAPYRNSGGVVYGFDDKTVRIWTAYLSEETRSKNYIYFGSLVGHPDGWGISSNLFGSGRNGSLKLSVWSADSFAISTDLYEYRGTLNQGIISKSTVDIENDLVTLYVQALDGDNHGFLFKGFGASQSVHKPYGGAIYAYNKKGQVIVWKPKKNNGGYLIHINRPYGNGKLNQASNVASYRVTLLRSTT